LIISLLSYKTVDAIGGCVGNLLSNPSFETPPIIGYGTTTQYLALSGLSGWTAELVNSVRPQECDSEEPACIELQRIWTPKDGAQYIELSCYCDEKISQSIVLDEGKEYELSYYYSPRPDISITYQGMSVKKDGVELNQVAVEGIGLTNTAWRQFTHSIIGTGDSVVISFETLNSEFGFGVLLDDVRLCEVITCEDTIPCQTVRVHDVIGCYYVLDDSLTCDDENECTVNDQCQNGQCVGTTKSCGSVGQCQNSGVCDPISGDCIAHPLPDGTECELDGNLCTVDKCNCGACTKDHDQCCVFTPLLGARQCGKTENNCRSNYAEVLSFFGQTGTPNDVIDVGPFLSQSRCCIPSQRAGTVVNGKCVYPSP
jgi:hypothetical protein